MRRCGFASIADACLRCLCLFFPRLLTRAALLPPPAEGWLQRVVVLGTETHVIEEIQLFETPQPVDSLTISHSKVRRTGGRGTWNHSQQTDWGSTVQTGAVRAGNVALVLRFGACFSSLCRGAKQSCRSETPTWRLGLCSSVWTQDRFTVPRWTRWRTVVRR